MSCSKPKSITNPESKLVQLSWDLYIDLEMWLNLGRRGVVHAYEKYQHHLLQKLNVLKKVRTVTIALKLSKIRWIQLECYIRQLWSTMLYDTECHAVEVYVQILRWRPVLQEMRRKEEISYEQEIGVLYFWQVTQAAIDISWSMKDVILCSGKLLYVHYSSWMSQIKSLLSLSEHSQHIQNLW